MARRLRVEYPGALYHVIQRGNNREDIFKNPQDKIYLIEQFRKAVACDGIELFAYAVMNNHYHLALRTLSEPLNKVMHRINTKYGIYFNKASGRSGHVFDGRYKAVLVEDDRYLFSLVRYIHNNPVRAGLCLNVQDYTWSSDCYYRKMEPGFVEFAFILDMLSGDRGQSIKEYDLLMSQGDDPTIETVIDTASVNKKSDDEEMRITSRKTLDEILRESIHNEWEFEFIKKGSRLRKLKDSKAVFVKSAWDNGYSMQEIASHINISAAAVFKYINKVK